MYRILRGTLVVILAALTVGTRASAQQGESEELQHVRRLAVELQKKVTQLPVASVNTALDAVKYATLALDDTLTVVDGMNNYAFRFTTPATPGDLMWSFQMPPGMQKWYICPATGTMNGFRNFSDKRLPRDVEGVGKKGDRFIIQRLYGSNLKPGTEYIMWFQFASGNPASVKCSVNVVAGEDLTVSHLFPYFWEEQQGTPAGLW